MFIKNMKSKDLLGGELLMLLARILGLWLKINVLKGTGIVQKVGCFTSIQSIQFEPQHLQE